MPGNEHPVITALRERHSTGKLKPDPVPRELVAFVYLGYPEFTQRRSRDGDGAAFTTWRG